MSGTRRPCGERGVVSKVVVLPVVVVWLGTRWEVIAEFMSMKDCRLDVRYAASCQSSMDDVSVCYFCLVAHDGEHVLIKVLCRVYAGLIRMAD